MHRHVSKVSLGNKFDDHKMIVRGRNHTGTAEPPNRATFSKRARPQQLRSGAPGTRPPLQGGGTAGTLRLFLERPALLFHYYVMPHVLVLLLASRLRTSGRRCLQ